MRKIYLYLIACACIIIFSCVGFILNDEKFKLVMANYQTILSSLMLLSATLGGFIGHICRNNGAIILPYLERLVSPKETEQVEILKMLQSEQVHYSLRLGVLADVFIGFGAGVASLFLLETKETAIYTAVSEGFAAGFLGQTLIQMITDKLQNTLGLIKVAKLGSTAYQEISYALNDLAELVDEVVNESTAEAQKNLAMKLPKIKNKITKIEDLSKKQASLLTKQTE